MDSQNNHETNRKNRIILDATEKIETVMEFDPYFQFYTQQINKAEPPPRQSVGLVVLWFLVLLCQLIIFVRQKGK